jgi:hypothetical protein
MRYGNDSPENGPLRPVAKNFSSDLIGRVLILKRLWRAPTHGQKLYLSATCYITVLVINETEPWRQQR